MNFKPMKNCFDLRARGSAAFSLVEVTLALGIVAFALVAVVGLLPAGLRSTQDAHDQARATDIMNMAVSGIQGSYYLGIRGDGNAAWSFANYFSDTDPVTVANDNTPPWDAHTTVFTNGTSWDYYFNALEDGSIRQRSDTRPPRYIVYIRVSAMPTDSNPTAPLSVYVSVAWPGTAVRDPAPAWPVPTNTMSKWKNAQGFVETTVYTNMPSPR